MQSESWQDIRYSVVDIKSHNVIIKSHIAPQCKNVYLDTIPICAGARNTTSHVCVDHKLSSVSQYSWLTTHHCKSSPFNQNNFLKTSMNSELWSGWKKNTDTHTHTDIKPTYSLWWQHKKPRAYTPGPAVGRSTAKTPPPDVGIQPYQDIILALTSRPCFKN